MSSSSSSSSSPSSSSTPTSTPNATTTLIIGIVIGILGVIGLIGIGWFIMRYRRKKRRPMSIFDKADTSMVGPLDWRHPAARITPFGANPRSSPRFTHIPGADMRIASRRADGVWEFSDPSVPFTPSGVSDLENTPSPSLSPSSASIFSYGGYSSTSAPYSSSKSKEAAEDKKGRRYSDYPYPSPDLMPPPAYAYGYTGNRDSVSSWGVSSVGATSSVGCLVPQPQLPSPSYGPQSPQLPP